MGGPEVAGTLFHDFIWPFGGRSVELGEPRLRGLRLKWLGTDGGAARLAWGGCISPAETQAAAWGRK